MKNVQNLSVIDNGFPVQKAAKIAVSTVAKFMEENSKCMDLVLFVLFDERTERVYDGEVDKLYR